MPTRLYIFLLIILTSCNSKSTDGNISERAAVKATETVSIASSKIQIYEQLKDTVGIKIDTLEINKKKFIQFIKNDNFNCLLSIKGDTIIPSKDYYFKVEFPDIDKDGNKDIRVFAYSNTPNQCDNYLFDKTKKIFILLENCNLDIDKLKGTDFYYSYNRAGCADMNWESTLSKIENYKLLNYGYIHGQGCDEEIDKYPQIIEVYRIRNSDTDQKELIKKLPYQKYIKEFGDKWSFIKSYWTKNYMTFER